ncbi:MAG: TAXI family TRAP transporter solute-binding subunit [Thermoanaerobacteraceae bacterium]|nr:TAXI family TRAP transporter solute-binding subunit [Thermoanaerobacteraceae bacterium]
MLFIMMFVISAGCGGGGDTNEHVINIATGTTSGVYYPLGNGLAQMWTDRVEGVKASAQATEASVQNMNLLQKKETDVAFSMNQVVANAYNGEDKFKGRANKNLRVLTALYPNVVQIVVPKNSDVNSIKDLNGKKFVPGAAGSGTETSAREILGLYGIDYVERQDVKVDYVGFTQAVELLKNRQTDGAYFSAGVPNAALMDLSNSIDIRLISLEQDMIDKIVSEMPWYFPYTIPAGTYKGQDEDIHTVAQANLLVTTTDLSEDLAYELTKAIFEYKSDLEAVHSAAKRIKKETAMSGLVGVPVHPGAARYFEEIGIEVPK